MQSLTRDSLESRKDRVGERQRDIDPRKAAPEYSMMTWSSQLILVFES